MLTRCWKQLGPDCGPYVESARPHSQISPRPRAFRSARCHAWNPDSGMSVRSTPEHPFPSRARGGQLAEMTAPIGCWPSLNSKVTPFDPSGAAITAVITSATVARAT